MKAADKDSKLHWNFKIDKLRQYAQSVKDDIDNILNEEFWIEYLLKLE